MAQLEINGISKSYGKKTVLDSFSAKMSDGVYGLLGPNGAGKTTLINIIAGILSADCGNISINGVDKAKSGKAYYNSIGFMPQYPKFYPNYTAAEIMEYMAALKGVENKERGNELLNFVNLYDSRDKKVGAFSGGMRQRLAIAAAMSNDPEILILDEPTAGLDPIERIRFRNIISQLGTDRIILIATHIVSDVEYMAQRIILLNEGKIIKDMSCNELCKSIEGKVWQYSPQGGDFDLPRYIKKHKVSEISHMLGMRIISDEPPAENAVSVTPKLDDVFLYYLDSMKTDGGERDVEQ